MLAEVFGKPAFRWPSGRIKCLDLLGIVSEGKKSTSRAPRWTKKDIYSPGVIGSDPGAFAKIRNDSRNFS